VRIWTYLQAMAPPQIIVPVALCKFAGAYFALQALSRRTPLQLDVAVWVGGMTVAGVLVLMRVYDEIKDAEHDLRLGRAGDPRYAQRPIVVGSITVPELARTARALNLSLVLCNLLLVDAVGLLACCGLLVVLWLSSRWFFWPAIERHLLLAFATHNPLTLVIGGYVVAVYAGRFAGIDGPGAALLLASMWLPVAAWETARKIRMPEDETDYETYSKIFGWQTAALIPGALVLAATLCLVTLAARAGLSPVLSRAFVALAMVPTFYCLRLRLRPSRTHARLQSVIEFYAGAVDILLLAGLVAAYGVDIAR
jgi:4-hydroxybenzoate polyprenyltransferase